MCGTSDGLELSTGPTNQESVMLYLNDQLVVTSSVADASQGGGCRAHPEVWFLAKGMYAGTPNMRLHFVVTTRTGTTSLPLPSWHTSQSFTLHSADQSCAQEGIEILYVGNGMFWHTKVQTSHPVVGGHGQLGLGMPGGAWTSSTSPWGWRNANMFFGGRVNRGWVMFNTTTPHPYRDHTRAPSHTTRVPIASNLAFVFSHGTLKIDVGRHRTTHGVTIHFVPDSRFLVLPPNLYDRYITNLSINVHNPDSAGNLPDMSLVFGELGPTFGEVAIQMQHWTITSDVPDADDPHRIFAIRRGSTPGLVVVGCSMTSLGIFVDASTYQPSDGLNAGSVDISMARVPNIQDPTTWNMTIFIVLCAASVPWALVIRSFNADLSNASVSRRISALYNEFAWWKEGMELLCAILSVVSITINTHLMALHERYAFFTETPENSEASSFVLFTNLVVWFHGAGLLVLVLVESVCKSCCRRTTCGAGSATPMSTSKRWSNPFNLIPMVVATGSVQEPEVGTFMMWVLYLMLRRALFAGATFTMIMVCRIEGPASSSALTVILFASISMFVFQTANATTVANTLLESVTTLLANPESPQPLLGKNNQFTRKRTSVSCNVAAVCALVQMALFCALSLSMMVYLERFFIMPTLRVVLWEFDGLSTWTVSLGIAVLTIVSIASVTCNAKSARKRKYI